MHSKYERCGLLVHSAIWLWQNNTYWQSSRSSDTKPNFSVRYYFICEIYLFCVLGSPTEPLHHCCYVLDQLISNRTFKFDYISFVKSNIFFVFQLTTWCTSCATRDREHFRHNITCLICVLISCSSFLVGWRPLLSNFQEILR